MATNHLTNDQRERIVELTKTGHSVRDIVNVMPLGSETVYDAIAEAGLQPFCHRRRLTDGEAAEAIRLASEGTAIADLCRKYGFSRNAMASLIAKASVARICPRCKKQPVERKCRVCRDCSLAHDVDYARAWRKRRLDAGLCACNRPILSGMTNCDICRERQRQRDRKIKEAVIAGYGGKCACCGETEIAFLTIDHVHNDGKHQRLHGDHGSSYRLYRKLIRENFPSYCACACFNCNHGRFINGGICPHQVLASRNTGDKIS